MVLTVQKRRAGRLIMRAARICGFAYQLAFQPVA
jgi:hypothetical protein